MRVLVATSNPGKLRDFAFAAVGLALPGQAGAGLELVPLPGLEGVAAPAETASTFAGNAMLKARAYSVLAPGELVLADDSGIVVPALDGRPRVRSARLADDEGWSASGTTDERNLRCLLALAAPLRGSERAASYRCVLALARDGQLATCAQGSLDGVLLEQPRGGGGFGYDPIFLVPELARSMAELDADTRLALSHRGRALVALWKRLREFHLGKAATAIRWKIAQARRYSDEPAAVSLTLF